jgi:hypothetical protein
MPIHLTANGEFMNKAPKWFLAVAIVALLWNLLGCWAFFADLQISPQELAKLSPAQQALYNARPIWAVVATALAVFGGALGCIGLLLRKKWALILFLLSLVGVLTQDFGLFVLANGAALAGPAAVILQSLVLVIAIGLVFLARWAIARRWLV